MKNALSIRIISASALASVLIVLGLAQSTVGAAPTATANSVVSGWQISQQTTTLTSANPVYTMTVSQPVLKSAGSNADSFNKAVQTVIDNAENDFKSSAADSQGTNNYLLMGYELYATDNNILSVRFQSEEFTGGAHPGHATITLNFDLQSGASLALSDVFAPKAKYLDVIAKFATDELKRENRLSFPDGAAPTAANYANWNIDHGGLLFTFDEYQVGPYAEGPSEVFIPYTVLGDLINSDFDQRILVRGLAATPGS